MPHYQHLTIGERYQIFSLLKAGFSYSAIALQINRHRSTIHRELNRNLVLDYRVTGYSPSRADSQAWYRRRVKPHFKISAETWASVIAALQQRWSPEQICYRRKLAGLSPISPESIYLRIWQDKRQGGTLWQCLRHRLRRGKRGRLHKARGLIVGRVGIEYRPAIVDTRSRIGDWEADTVFGRQSQAPLLTLVDRRSRYCVIAPLKSKHASHVGERMVAALSTLNTPVHTITSDNGKEFAQHVKVSQALQADFYFARPYASWERGTNENTNGLLRQFFPKQHDFNRITNEDIENAMNLLNNRPRKCLGWFTPNEVFFNLQAVALRS
jgi:transposase, IS30 family